LVEVSSLLLQLVLLLRKAALQITCSGLPLGKLLRALVCIRLERRGFMVELSCLLLESLDLYRDAAHVS
jgi:hypothetical protein